MKVAANEPGRVQDRRNGRWWWCHHAIIDNYGETLGPYGLAVYAALCRYANTDGACWPSIATLAKRLGMSPNRVRKSLSILETLGLISVEYRKTEDDVNLTSVYTLLEVPLHPVKEGTSPGEVRVLHPVKGGTSPGEAKQDSGKKTYFEQEPEKKSVAPTAQSPVTAADELDHTPDDEPELPSKQPAKRTPDKTADIPADAAKTPPPHAAPPPSPSATWDDIHAAPDEARGPARARGASKDAIEQAIGDVCYGANRDLRIANMGEIRRWAKVVRDTNGELEEPVTAETIYDVYVDSGYWQKHFLSLDGKNGRRQAPTPGIIGKHTVTIRAWGREVESERRPARTPLPPPPGWKVPEGAGFLFA